MGLIIRISGLGNCGQLGNGLPTSWQLSCASLRILPKERRMMWFAASIPNGIR